MYIKYLDLYVYKTVHACGLSVCVCVRIGPTIILHL